MLLLLLLLMISGLSSSPLLILKPARSCAAQPHTIHPLPAGNLLLRSTELVGVLTFLALMALLLLSAVFRLSLNVVLLCVFVVLLVSCAVLSAMRSTLPAHGGEAVAVVVAVANGGANRTLVLRGITKD